MEKEKFWIEDFLVGDKRAMIVAEAGVNHDGDFKKALNLIELAKASGADAVKFQAFTAEGLCDLTLEETKDVKTLIGESQSSFKMYKSLEFSDEELLALQEHARENEITFFLSVFDEVRADFLNQMNIPAYKIASGDLTFYPLLEKVASFGKPVILSTGMASEEEVALAIDFLEEVGAKDVCLLHCVSDYPPRDEEINLRSIELLKARFDCPIGYSDHSIGLEIPYAAAALGISMLEKHFTYDESAPGPDHAISLGPKRFQDMVEGIRRIEKARGSFSKEPSNAEKKNILTTRRGAKASKYIQKGDILTKDNVRFVKPSSGFSPDRYLNCFGKRVTRDFSINEPIGLESIQAEKR